MKTHQINLLIINHKNKKIKQEVMIYEILKRLVRTSFLK